MARPIALALVAGSMLFAGASRAPETTQYKVHLDVTSVVDLSGVGGAEQRNHVLMTGYFTMTLTDTTGGRAMRAVLDSMTADSVPQITQAIQDSARGSTWTGLVGPDNRITNLNGPEGNVAAAQFQGIMSDFFPRLRPGTKVGDTWSDTSNTTNESDASTSTTNTITNYSVTGTESRHGASALKVETAFAFSQTGTVNNPTGSFNMDGTGTGHGTFYVTQKGKYLGGMIERSAQLAITGAAPDAIPVSVDMTLNVSTMP
jgi:hypothetical protein